MNLPRTSVDDLRGKYAEMFAMRLAHAGGGEDRRTVRVRMAALSHRFPGALREIDRLELTELCARIAKLDAVVAGETVPERWMVAVALFHELMRGALSVKRWLRGARRVDDATRAALIRELHTLAFPDDAHAWVEQLQAVAAPPGGHVTELVYARIGHALDTPDGEVRRLVFGA